MCLKTWPKSKEGFDVYISKPINKQLLEETINKLLLNQEKDIIAPSNDVKPTKTDLHTFPSELLDMSKPLKEIQIDTEAAEREYIRNEQFSSVYVTKANSNTIELNNKGNIEYLKSNGIDVNHGLDLLGDIDMYNETLNDFVNAIDDILNIIKRLNASLKK